MTKPKLGITGTFLDEITHDIPSQNWGAREWAKDFDAMRAIGIDTVILIRAGYRKRVTFDSKVLRERVQAFPAYLDLVDIYLNEAERCGMKFFFGTYDSGTLWNGGRYREEVDLNRAFCDEVAMRYAHRKAFQGWYISHEVHAFDEGMVGVYEDLSRHLRGLKDVPILMSPYVKGVKQFGDQATSLEAHMRSWDAALARLKDYVDIVAFQDGQMAFEELPAYIEANVGLAKKHGLTAWSNVENFDRDMPIKFPPIDHRMLKYKMEQAALGGAEKLITFEFSHFMSPNSCYPSARNLYDRYREWLEEQ